MRARWIAVAAMAALTGGCGESGDESRPASGASDREQVEAAVAGYMQGLAEGDGDAACRHLSSDARATFAARAQTSTCPEAAEELAGALDDDALDRLRDARVDGVTMGGDKADVKVVSGDESLPDPISVRRIEGAWTVNALPREVTFRSRAAAECIAGGMREFDSGGGHSFWRTEGRADYEDYIATTCRRADKQGLLAGPGNEPELQKIAGQVVLEMIRRGQIRDPRG